MLDIGKWEPAGKANQTLGKSVKLGPTGLLAAEITRRPSAPPMLGESRGVWWLVKISVHGRIQLDLDSLDVVGRIFADDTPQGVEDKLDEFPWSGWEIGAPDTWLIYAPTLSDAIRAADRFMIGLSGAYAAEVAGVALLGPEYGSPTPEINEFLKWQEEAVGAGG